MVSVDVNDHERRGRGKVSVSLTHWPGTWGKVNMVLYVHRNHKAYWGRGEEGEEVMEVWEEGDYIPIATLSPPE